MQTNLVFNPEGNDLIENRSIWFGNTTNLMQLNDVKYSWAIHLYSQMRANFWIPQKLDLTQDVTDYNNLTEAEVTAYEGILSYLTFLDSIQTVNLPHIKNHITAPEISLCIAEQISQEAMHNASYQYIIETVIPKDRRQDIYDFWRKDSILKERCQYIASLYQNQINNPSEDNYFISLLANYLLESIYFYNGFCYFYNLASRMLMPGSADIFKMINRDELSHVRLYQKLIIEAIPIFKPDLNFIYQMFDEVVKHEIIWTKHIIGDLVLGITTTSTEQYTKYLANLRLKAIGLNPLYPDQPNPYKHLEKLSDTKKEGTTKANFFESGVTSYSMSSGLTGWDF